MQLANVGLIFRREVSDQLRDRRTLFMIFLLPVVLYPLLGFGMTQMTAAFEQKERRVGLVGAEHLPSEPALLAADGSTFARDLFDSEQEAQRLRVERVEAAEDADWSDPARGLSALRSGGFDTIVIVPSDVREQIESFRQPTLELVYDRGSEEGQTTYLRLREVLSRWQDQIVSRRLEADGKPKEYTRPLNVAGVDVSARDGAVAASGSVWARLLPFLLVMMSLTGAFYPAIDLCAGEKERGTMETLLISPASRGEIVLGKFLTIMLASIITALLNLASMGLTMMLAARQITSGAAGSEGLSDFQPPSPGAIGWMLLLLIPLSMFFSALCLSLAVMARSMKEGQYYLTPLYMVALPLMFLTLMPGVQLTPFFSIVPITGVALLLKALMSGQYIEAQTYLLPVLLTTLAYAALALRWAVDQFQSESVLFREAERFEPLTYVRHLLRDKGPVPTTGAAVACFATILTLSWYVSLLLSGADPLRGMVIGHILFILGPPVVFALLFTKSPRTTLRLRWPGWSDLALAAGLAIAIHPLSSELRPWVETYFPVPKHLVEAMGKLFEGVSLPVALAVFALMPAITEEVAFRGFILSGLRTGHKAGSAVIISAVLFGLMHVVISLFQQFFNATILGVVLGWLALKTRSLYPGVIFHALSNGLAVLAGVLLAEPGFRERAGWLFRDPDQGLYGWPWVILAAVVAGGLLVTLSRKPMLDQDGQGRPESAGALVDALPA